jgi:hypothetical protein
MKTIPRNPKNNRFEPSFSFKLSVLKVLASSVLIMLTFLKEDVRAQGRIRDGYIIAASGDTIKGLIDYAGNEKSFSECRFKEAKEDLWKTYVPSEIMGYGLLKDKVFIAQPYDSSQQKVFFEIVVKGHVSLYRLINSLWLCDSTGRIHELRNDLKVRYHNGKRVQVSSNQHIAVMNQLMSDCRVLNAKGRPITLAVRPVTEIVEKYNKCKGADYITYQQQKPWISPDVGVTLGVAQSFLKTNGFTGIVGDVEPSTDIFLGLTFDVMFPRVSERVSIHTSAIYSSVAYYNYYHSTNHGPTINYVTLKLNQLKLPVGFRYRLSPSPKAAFLDAGVSVTWQLSPESNLHTEELIGGYLVKENQESMPFKPRQYGLWMGAGVSRPLSSKLTGHFELRVEFTNGIGYRVVTPYYQWSSSIYNFQLFMGVRKVKFMH